MYLMTFGSLFEIDMSINYLNLINRDLYILMGTYTEYDKIRIINMDRWVPTLRSFTVLILSKVDCKTDTSILLYC